MLTHTTSPTALGQEGSAEQRPDTETRHRDPTLSAVTAVPLSRSSTSGLASIALCPGSQTTSSAESQPDHAHPHPFLSFPNEFSSLLSFKNNSIANPEHALAAKAWRGTAFKPHQMNCFLNHPAATTDLSFKALQAARSQQEESQLKRKATVFQPVCLEITITVCISII